MANIRRAGTAQRLLAPKLFAVASQVLCLRQYCPCGLLFITLAETRRTPLLRACDVSKIDVQILSPNPFSSQVKTLLADGIHVDSYGQLCASTSYESNVPFVLRFMVRPGAELKHVLCVEIQRRSRPGLCFLRGLA